MTSRVRGDHASLGVDETARDTGGHPIRVVVSGKAVKQNDRLSFARVQVREFPVVEGFEPLHYDLSIPPGSNAP